DYFEVPMAAPRGLVAPRIATDAIIPFTEALPNVEHLRGRLVELSPRGGLVDTAGGGRVFVESKITVLATGSRFANELVRAPEGTATERKAFYEKIHQQLAAAQRILIIGGGPIGVEVAGELTQTWPRKAITIVERGPRILAGTSAEVAAHAESVLRSRGVTILTNEQIAGADRSVEDVFAEGGEVKTGSGRQLSYDLALWCIGGRANTAYMQQHFGSVITPEGRIKVSADLRVVGQQSIFALGDITDLAENKMA
ncbi:FAD-dependent oxidoreductase, partial [Burkholderia sp. BCC1977]|uniref:FAD-dependent oxidoreductase n=1 Tax=Burkholderia sp. BCC1977 TaxID=2817440 RepID=UPI002ABD87CD